MVFPTTKSWGVDPGSPVAVAKKMRLERMKREREDPYDFKIEEGDLPDLMDVDTPHKKIKTEAEIKKEDDIKPSKVSQEIVSG